MVQTCCVTETRKGQLCQKKPPYSWETEACEPLDYEEITNSCILQCCCQIYLLYDLIILMPFIHNRKLEYVEQMHIMSLPIILHQTDVLCSHGGGLGHSKSILVATEGYSSFILAKHIYKEP